MAFITYLVTYSMTTNYILAPNGRWSARNLVGEAARNALLFTYTNQTRDPKTTFQDPGGITPNPNPLQLDSKGEANIYWATDELYTIAIYQFNSASGTWSQLIYSQDNYPTVGSGSSGDITIVQSFPNLIRNPQFTLWGVDDLLTTDAATTKTRINSGQAAQDWELIRDNANASISISRELFAPGQTDVPANPIYYLNFQTTSVGAGGETAKYLAQYYDSVTTLQNEQISWGFWARSVSSSTITLYFTQIFGQGGSPSPENIFGSTTCALTPSWQFFSGTTTVPTILGKTIGSEGRDSLRLNVGYPLNVVCNVDLANFQLHDSSTLPNSYPYLTVNDQQKLTDYLVTQATFKTGDVKFTIRPNADPGWLMFDDSTFGSSFSGATHANSDSIYLFQLIWNQIPNTLCAIYNSDGTIGTRGADAISDFNADKRLSLPRIAGRVIGAAGVSSTGLTTRHLGEYVGAETVVLTATNLPPHVHPGFLSSQFPPQTPGVLGSTNAASPLSPTDFATTANGATTGLNSTPVSIMQPSQFLNVMIKL